MKDYAAMSDQQINRMVAAAAGMEYGAHYMGDIVVLRGNRWVGFDPCNNPADAWPIIMQHKINMTFGDNTPAPDEWGYADAMCKDKNHNEYEWYEKSGNPLRAAMIVFLEMKESKND